MNRLRDNLTARVDRIAAMQPSQIRELHNLAQDLRRQHPSRSFISLHFGEPDLGTPPFIIDAACAALRNGAVFYENNSGRPDLREALCHYYRDYYYLDLTPDHFVVTCGGTQAILLAMLALVSPGDQVIMTTPCWPNIAESARLAGAIVQPSPLVFDEESQAFSLDFNALERTIRTASRPRLLVVNSPSNPTGWVMTRAQQQDLIQLCRAHDLYLMSDEIYDRIVFTSEPFSTCLAQTDGWDKLVVINGFSKTHCMTGWRLGYLIADPSLAIEMARMQEFVTSHAPSMAQVAAITALREGEPFVRQNLDRYRDLRDMVQDRLMRLPGAVVARTDGTFYSFFCIPASQDSVRFSKDLLVETGVVLAPGQAFGSGGESWLRLCFANDPKVLDEGLSRLSDFIRRGS